MEQADKTETNPDLDMPFEDGFDEWDIPLVIYLKGHEYPCKSCEKKCDCQASIPDFPVQVEGINTYPVKDQAY
jgi:hypothetical protein